MSFELIVILAALIPVALFFKTSPQGDALPQGTANSAAALPQQAEPVIPATPETAPKVSTISDFDPEEDVLLVDYEGYDAPAVTRQKLSKNGLTVAFSDGNVIRIRGLRRKLDDDQIAFSSLAKSA